MSTFNVLLTRKLRVFTLFVLSFFIFQSNADAQLTRDDLNRVKGDKQEFMLRRAEAIAQKRGVEKDKPFDPTKRVQAVEQLELQKAQRAAQRASQRLAPEATWTELGPNPIPNGQVIAGPQTPVSGRTTAIAVHPTNPNIVYVGTAQGGLYRTTDGGTTWTPLMDNAMSLAIGAIAIAPSSPETVYVGTGEPNFSNDCYFGVGIYRINNASSANPTITGPLNDDALNNDVFTGRSVSRILVHPTNPATIFVSTTSGVGGIGYSGYTSLPGRGIYRCTDATAADPTFTKLIGIADFSIRDMVLDPLNPNLLVCNLVANGGGGGIYRTTNALAATPVFTQTLTMSSNTYTEFAIHHTNPLGLTTIYAASGFSDGTVWKSIDAGATWTLQIDNNFCGGQCFYDIAIAVDPVDATRVYLGGDPTLVFGVSANSGVTFTNNATTAAGLHTDSHTIGVSASDPSIIYFGSDGGIYKSTNAGSTWTSLNNSTFRATQFMGLAVHPTDANFTIGGTQDNGTNYLRPDGTWYRSDYGDGGYAVIDQNATDVTNVTMYHTYFNKSNLMGYARVTAVADATEGNWAFFGCGFGGSTPNGMTCSATACLFYAPMEQGPGNPNTLYFGSDVLYRSADGGTTMTKVSQEPIAFGKAISAIGIAPQNDNVRLVGLTNGGVFGTITGASTLTNLDASNVIPDVFVARAVIDPQNVNTAYITLSAFGVASVWKTTTLNATNPTWTSISAGIPQVPVNAFVVDPLNSNTLYAGTDIGVYISENGGTSWAPMGTGLPTIAVFDMAYTANNKLRIATHGRGLWEIAATPPVSLTCPNSATVAACQTQAAVNTQFANWLSFYDASGGCNGVVTNNNTGAPSACGGSTTVTFTYTSTCIPLTTTCQATFTVPAAPVVALTCPTNTTIGAGQTQTAINTQFATWLATASASGGCNGVLTNNNTGAPSAAGGSTTVTFTYTSACAPLTTTCQATFTVPPPVVLTCAVNTTIGAGQTQAAINTQFATWLATATASGGCNGVLTNDNTGAPSAAGGSTTVTFTYTSTCAPLTTSCQATFTVPAPVVLTCAVNSTVGAGQTQAAINTQFATWLATASASGGCNGILTNNNTGAPSAAGGSTTVTFTYTSTCTPLTTTCQATFTVPAAVTVNCPTNTTIGAGQTQAAINTQFATWLATASVSGGCNGVLTNDNTGAPSAAGGSTTVTFTYTSTCAPLTTTCQATFTVPAPVVLTCAVNTTTTACSTQTAINTQFANWLATASASGGCNGILTNNNTGAPSACGGSTTVTFTYTSTCTPFTTTCQATFTVPAAPVVALTCPTNTTIGAGQTQTAINTQFATWLATAGVSGGCNGVLTNDNTGAPSAAGGSTTVTFTYTSTCAPLTTTCQATFTVPAPVVLTCAVNTTTTACSTQTAINTQFANWLATASASGGCNGILTNNNTGAPSACGGSTTVTFTYTSTCTPLTTTCQATFTVPAAPVVALTCPTNTTIGAGQTQTAINMQFATWLATASASGGCDGVLTNNNTGAPSAAGGSTTVTFTYFSACAPLTTTCQATFIVPAPVVLTCPINTTTNSCQSQAAINTQFNTWLASASAIGGCNGVLTNNNTGAPAACGGSTTVTFTYTSTCTPLTTTCQATFTVPVSAPVVITCPAPITVSCASAVPAVNTGSVTIVSGCNVVITHIADVVSAQTCANRYVITRTYRGTDGCGNFTNCTQTITVNDQTGPVITCPANSTATTTAGSCTAIVNYTVTATDNCGAVSVVSAPASGTAFPIGTTTVTSTATDACGNTSTCSFTVTVTDGQLPVIATQPQNRAVCAGQNAIFSVSAITSPIANGTLSYQWQNWNGSAWVNIAGANASSYTVANTTLNQNTNSFRVVVIGSCTTINSGAASLTVNPNPTVQLSTNIGTALLPNEQLTILATPSIAGGTYQWFRNGVVLNGSVGSTLGPLSVTDAGTYRVVYTAPTGCVTTSTELVVSALASSYVWIYPNPNNGVFNLRFFNRPGEEVTVRVFNAQGNLMYDKKVLTAATYTTLQVNLAENKVLTSGVYAVVLYDSKGNELETRKLVIYTN